MDTLDDFLISRPATGERPLAGLTVLLVEDSRFASDGFRLLCLRSGARIRRADSLGSARRHLRVYRPSVVIVDIGLPDGSGAELIAELDRARPRVPVILATSGDADEARSVAAAGADGFLPKPVERLAAFQAAILDHLPPAPGGGPRLVSDDEVHPDLVAYRDDLMHVAETLHAGDAVPGDGTVAYLTQFLTSVALSAGDTAMAEAAEAVARGAPGDGARARDLAHLTRLVDSRVAGQGPL
ncbi:response regulator [Wenxinia marina]|uniref:Response regulator n=1 Tax=Wenxinia marina DSM 24838 TaxID=1123501 RepID=A0A0D0QF52_9RHOB|nr:response regulator [Wenxinia marina]KIQ69623.1 Response regulator [Wenxinia marina DSM 24838]GGL59825.1 response regulator [Wenxinia marina]